MSNGKVEAVRIYIREVPLGPMPGFPLQIPRCVVNILIPNIPLDDEDLLAIAIEQKDRVLSFGKHYNALAFHFWTEEQGKAKRIEKEPAVAIIDYAPRGKWENALEAKISDYSNHSFKIISNKTKKEDDNATESEV